MTGRPHPPDPGNDCAPSVLPDEALGTEQQRDGNCSTEAPEHRNDRRRFLVWALMLGATTPDRLTARIVAEVEGTP